MKIDIIQGPGNAAAHVKLKSNETLVAEGGAMIAMSSNISISTTTHQRSGGGITSGLKRMLSRESFFLNHFTATSDGATVTVAPTLSGDIRMLELKNTRLVVQSGSYVACEQSVEMNIGWQGFKSLFAKEGLFWINLSGQGKVLVNSFGAIYPIEVDGEYIVDTGHIVAFDETLHFSLSKAGRSWLSSILGGEGLVCRFKGKGTVWCQSHSATAFGQSLGKQLKPIKR